jgi:hypothetical protein
MLIVRLLDYVSKMFFERKDIDFLWKLSKINLEVRQKEKTYLIVKRNRFSYSIVKQKFKFLLR